MRVWKLKEEKTCEEYRCMVEDKVEEAKWKGLCVNDHWQQMKGYLGDMLSVDADGERKTGYNWGKQYKRSIWESDCRW